MRLRGCQLGQWCMKLPPFIGMAFNQLLLGICPWLCSGATYNSAPCTCPHLTTPFNAFPPQPHFHSCINIISPVKKTRTTCSLPLLFLMVYAEQPTLSQFLPMSLNSTRAGSMPADPPPAFLLALFNPTACPPAYTSPLFHLLDNYHPQLVIAKGE